MPELLISEKVPLPLSIVAFPTTKDEQIFLTYAHGRENGSEIQRTGQGSPFMEHLSPSSPGEITTHPFGLRLSTWLILEALRPKDRNDADIALRAARTAAAPDPVIRTLDEYLAECPIISAHDTESSRAYPECEITGMQGCGDLTMNFWKVAFLHSRTCLNHSPTLIYLHNEPLAQRTYPCLVKWASVDGAPPRMSIEDLRFSPLADRPHEMVWRWDPGTERWQTCGDQVELAAANPQVVRGGRVADLSRMSHMFSDLRHMLRMPNLNPCDTYYSGDPARPRIFFGKPTQDDIWLGETQLICDVNLQRAALSGPVLLSRLAGGLGAPVIQVREALVAFGYREQPDARAELAAGEFRFVPEDTSLVEVFLLRNRYGWTMIGLTKDGDSTLCLACEGDPHANRGHILASAAQRLIDAGAWNAVLIDEGADMFQAALLEGGGGPPLQATIPLKRTRLRATFVFGRRRASEGGG